MHAVKLAAKAGREIAALRARILPEQRDWLDAELEKRGVPRQDVERYIAAHNRLERDGEIEPGVKLFQLAGIAPVNESETAPARPVTWVTTAGKLTALVEKLPKTDLIELRKFYLSQAERIAKLI